MSKIDAVALAELVENSGVSFRKGSASYVFTCPKCSKKEKLYMRRSNGQFICFYCAETQNFRGKPEFALTELLGISISDIRRKLYGSITPEGDAMVVFNLQDFWGDDPEPEETYLASIPTPDDFMDLESPQGKEGLDYLLTRGISLERAREYRLCYWVTKKRVVFPVYDGERFLGYQARLIHGNTEFIGKSGDLVKIPKILTSPGLQRDQIVMFMNRLQGADHVFIAEGPVDAMKAHLCGGNVATMGKSVSTSQLDLIRTSGVKRVYIALDPDAEAEAQGIARRLGDLECYRVLPAQGFKDLGEMTEEAVYQQFLEAREMNAGHLALNLRLAF